MKKKGRVLFPEQYRDVLIICAENGDGKFGRHSLEQINNAGVIVEEKLLVINGDQLVAALQLSVEWRIG